MQAEIEDLVHRMVQEFRQTRFLPGGAVGVVTPGLDGGPEPFRALVPFGVADVATGAPVGPDTLFEIGSVSKLFTALGLASTMTQPGSAVDLQTPLQDLAPVRVPRLGPAPITLGHLVTHRSGLPRMPGNMIPGPQGHARYQAADLWSAVASTSLLFAPGTGYQYSNFGFGVLGTILSDLTGRPYGDVVDAAVCRPLALSRTYLQPPLAGTPAHLAWWRHAADAKDDGPSHDEATPYRQESTAEQPVAADHWNSTGALAGSGGIVSTGRDMTTFLAAAIGFGPGAPASAFRMIRQPIPATDPTLPEMGMAWQFRVSKLPG